MKAQTYHILNKLKLLVLCLSFFSPTPAKALEFDWDLMAFYETQIVRRGALFWPDPGIFVGPTVTVNGRLKIRGPQLIYKTFPKESSFQWEFGTLWINDDGPLIRLTDHEKDFRSSRRQTFEAFTELKYKFGFHNLGHLALMLSRDVKEHSGHYARLKLSIPILPLLIAIGKVSYGDQDMHEYFYGVGGNAGTGFWSTGGRLICPLPLNGALIGELTYTELFQEENQQASLVQGAYKHTFASARIVLRF